MANFTTADRIRIRAEEFQSWVLDCLKRIVTIPSFSGQEEAVILEIQKIMNEMCCFDEVFIDGLGNVLGRMGSGSKVLVFDGHADTVGVGDLSKWTTGPHEPTLRGNNLYGLGTADQKAGIASMLLAAKLIKELGLVDGYTIYFVASVQEEDHDGGGWDWILKNGVLRKQPDLFVSTEPSHLCINRGHRGRMEPRILVKGKSQHGSRPHDGVNALEVAAYIMAEIKRWLAPQLAQKAHPLLGAGSITTSFAEVRTASFCSVAHETLIFLDRRLTIDDTEESVLNELYDVLQRLDAEPDSGLDARADVSVYVDEYTTRSWRGAEHTMKKKFYPAWTTPVNSPWLTAATSGFTKVLQQDAVVGATTFSTNATTVAGLHNIPCLVMGPGFEKQAHVEDSHVPVDHLWQAAAGYAGLVAELSGKL